jgi:hypothetical protein
MKSGYISLVWVIAITAVSQTGIANAQAATVPKNSSIENIDPVAVPAECQEFGSLPSGIRGVNQQDLMKYADQVATIELRCRVAVRNLERKRDIAKLNSEIAKFNAEMQSKDSAFPSQMQPIFPTPEFQTRQEIPKQAVPVPDVVGYVSGKAMFRSGGNNVLAGAGDVLKGGYKVISVEPTLVKIRTPAGTILPLQIAWDVSR